MLTLTSMEKKILTRLLTAEPKVVASELKIPVSKVYNTISYFRRKVQNAEEFLSVAKGKYKPLLQRRLKTPKIVPEDEEEGEDWSEAEEDRNL